MIRYHNKNKIKNNFIYYLFLISIQLSTLLGKIMSEIHPLSKQVASIVLAGGQGTRLHPLTQHRCKPAVCFAGKHRLIDIPISNSLNAQIHHIFVVSQYFAAGLQQHLASAYPHTFLQQGHLEMLCPEETSSGINWFLGTADAVRKNKHYLEHLPVDYFLILSGDQLYHMDLLDMVAQAKETNADLVIASLLVKEQEAKRMGLLKIDQEKKVLDFYEKPQSIDLLRNFCVTERNKTPLYLGSMGIYIFKKKALLDLLQEEGNDFGKDLIPLKIQDKTSYAFVYEGYWEDIGTVSSYYNANLALTEQKNCLDLYKLWHPLYAQTSHLPSPLIKTSSIDQAILGDGSIIEAQKVHHSIVGTRSILGPGSIVENSVLIGNYRELPLENRSSYTVGKNSILQGVIVDEEAFIGDNVKLINKDKLSLYEKDGIFIRDGIIVVTSGTRVPDGFSL